MANTQSLDLESSSSQYASRAANALFDFGTGPFTLECWFKRESTTFGGFLVKSTTDSAGYVLRNDNGTVVFRCGNGTNQDSTDAYTLNDTSWHHFAGVRDGSKLHLYVDTVEVGTAATDNARNTDTAGNVVIGPYRSEDLAINFSDGLIDEVRIWSDARTPTEIASNWKKDVTGQTGLVAYWKLNGAWTDESGNSLTLSNSGSPSFSTTVPFPDYLTDSGFFAFL